MANNPQLTDLAANTAVNAVVALLNSGFLKIYTTPQPANANTAITTQTLLATLTFSATAAPNAVAGVATFNAITSDTNAAATGTAVWFRVFKSDNSTAVFDGSVGTSGADLNLSSTAITQHGTVAVSSFTYTQNEHN
jgi:hypothetical protein